MAATRENVLAAIVQYVENNGRRAPAKVVAEMVGDKLPAVQEIIKGLIADGAINSSRGRNGGILPDGVTLDKPAKKVAAAVVAADPQPAIDPAVQDQFAALLAQMDREDAQSQNEEAVAQF